MLPIDQKLLKPGWKLALMLVLACLAPTVARAEQPALDFTLRIMKDGLGESGQAPCVMKLEVTYDRLVTDSIGEVVIWWTTPAGRRSRFNLPPVEAGFWASRLDPGPEQGVHHLSLVVMLEDEVGKVADIYQQGYSLQMPQLILTAETGIEHNAPGRLANLFDSPISLDEPAELPHADGQPGLGEPADPTESAGLSLPAIAVLILMINVVLSLVGGLGYLIYRHMPGGAGGPGLEAMRRKLHAAGIVASEDGAEDSDEGPEVREGEANSLSERDMNDLERELEDLPSPGGADATEMMEAEPEDLPEPALASVGAAEEPADDKIDLSDLKF